LQAALTAEVERCRPKYKAPFVLAILKAKAWLSGAAAGMEGGHGIRPSDTGAEAPGERDWLVGGDLGSGADGSGDRAEYNLGAVPGAVGRGIGEGRHVDRAGQGPAWGDIGQGCRMAQGVLKAMLAAKMKFGVVVVLAWAQLCSRRDAARA